ncbi:MAG TPA: hypothetical protein VN975_03290 [Xanthobacteraceae bacterium]|jgi:hypothetical protein|nr:hypothetical protein [Xanthobacteraceae bacterium]
MVRMQSPKREVAPLAQAPALIYAVALTCGVLASLALQVYLRGAGFDLASLWENMFATGTRQLRTAGPWWAIAGLAFLTGGIAAAALSRLPLPWRRFRLLRWAAGGAIVFVLAQIGDPSAGSEAVGAGLNLAVNLVALALAAVMALAGAYVAVRR